MPSDRNSKGIVNNIMRILDRVGDNLNIFPNIDAKPRPIPNIVGSARKERMIIKSGELDLLCPRIKTTIASKIMHTIIFS